MADIVSSAVRSRMMSGIRAANTKPELMIRSALHREGFRYRLHDRKLPGTPDLVFRSRKAVLFVHGCFWHGHDCHLFRLPKTRTEFWQEKIAANRQRDEKTVALLTQDGWRLGSVWECALKGRSRLPFAEVATQLVDWLNEPHTNLEIRGSE